jgi:hypothetical protein
MSVMSQEGAKVSLRRRGGRGLSHYEVQYIGSGRTARRRRKNVAWLHLRESLGWSYALIAAAEGVSKSTVYERIRTARAELRKIVSLDPAYRSDFALN